jgi:endonuclease YncB( thermonuclease family)
MFKYLCCCINKNEILNSTKTNPLNNCNISKNTVLSPTFNDGNKINPETEDEYVNLVKKKLDTLTQTERNNMKCFSFKDKIFYGYPSNVYDGDTFSFIFIYKDDILKYRCRCNGYDSPEMKPALNNPKHDNEKKLAHNAKNRFIELLEKHPTKIIKVKCSEFDKYGRLLVDVWNMKDDKSINEIMIEEGHGKVYDGGTKEKW